MSVIKDINLKSEGHQRIQWVARHMPVLNAIGDRFEKEKPFKGLRIALSIHLEAKTAYLVKTLARGGAEMSVTGSNPRSTQDTVCAALVDDGITVHAIHGVSQDEYRHLLRQTLAVRPHIVIDDGADLVDMLLGDCKEYASEVIGGCEETTSGVQRLHGWEHSGRLNFPVMAVNDACCKSYFDNTYGTGQSSWDAIMRTTNLQINGRTVVVAGYGYCGRGVAGTAKGLGAQVIVTEVDPIQGILAIMDGYKVMSMAEAARLGDIFVTVTGCCNVIRPEHFAVMKDNAIVSNAGHFNIEIDVAGLHKMAVSTVELRKNLMGYVLENGRTIGLIAEGGLVNIAAGDGHPVEIMDMSFALQALGAEYIANNHKKLKAGVHKIPRDIDEQVASHKLESLGGTLDTLSEKQKEYLLSH